MWSTEWSWNWSPWPWMGPVNEWVVTQLYLTLCVPMDCSPPCFSVHGIFQARVLEWGAIPFSRGSSQPRDWTWVSHIVGRHFTVLATREVQMGPEQDWKRHGRRNRQWEVMWPSERTGEMSKRIILTTPSHDAKRLGWVKTQKRHHRLSGAYWCHLRENFSLVGAQDWEMGGRRSWERSEEGKVWAFHSFSVVRSLLFFLRVIVI